MKCGLLQVTIICLSVCYCFAHITAWILVKRLGPKPMTDQERLGKEEG